jgi:hypothetical protein
MKPAAVELLMGHSLGISDSFILNQQKMSCWHRVSQSSGCAFDKWYTVDEHNKEQQKGVLLYISMSI